MRCGLAGEVKIQLLHYGILIFLGDSAALLLIHDTFEDSLRVVMMIIHNFLVLTRRLNYRISTKTTFILFLDYLHLYLSVIRFDDILLWRHLSAIPEER